MSIYICITEEGKGKKDRIVLNRNYSKEQIAEILRASDSYQPGYWIEEVLTEGIYLQEDLTIKSCAFGFITNETKGWIKYFNKKDIIIINPEAETCIKPHVSLFKRISNLLR